MAGIDPDITIEARVTITFFGIPIVRTFTMTTPLTGLQNAQGADTALTAEIATYIQDVATKLNTALQSGDSDAAVQQIADDLEADATALKNADPLNPPTVVVPSNPVTPSS
jgi:hypothetical protein